VRTVISTLTIVNSDAGSTAKGCANPEKHERRRPQQLVLGRVQAAIAVAHPPRTLPDGTCSHQL
jgi:hypothetical protein